MCGKNQDVTRLFCSLCWAVLAHERESLFFIKHLVYVYMYACFFRHERKTYLTINHAKFFAQFIRIVNMKIRRFLLTWIMDSETTLIWMTTRCAKISCRRCYERKWSRERFRISGKGISAWLIASYRETEMCIGLKPAARDVFDNPRIVLQNTRK